MQQRRASDPENVDAWAQLHARFADLGRYEASVIDANGAPQEVAAALMAAFGAGRLQVS